MSIDTEYAVRRDIRNNPVLRQVDSRHHGELRRYVLLVGSSVLMLLFSAWQRSSVQDYGRKIERLRLEQAAELVDNRKLRLNVETYLSPQDLERKALGMGMRAPALGETLVIERAPESSSAGGVVAFAR